MEVLHRRLDVRVAHPFLDAADVGDADDPRPERVAEVVEAERSQCGSFELGVRGAHERHDLLRGEDVDLGPQGGARLLDVDDGFAGQPMELACSLHDAVKDRDRLLAGAVGEPAVRVDLDSRPALDALGRQLLEGDVAEVSQDVVAEVRLVVAERGWLPLPVLLDERRYSAHASATVAPVRTMPDSVPAAASPSTRRSQASAERLVK